MHFEAVIFDYVGVLVEMDRRRAAEFFRERAPLPISALTRRWEEWCSDHIGEVPSGSEMWKNYWSHLGRELGISAEVLAEIHAFDYFGMFRACPDALPALAAAREHGLRIGVLSSSVLPRLTAPTAPLPLAELTDVIAVPRRGGPTKPDRNAYLEVASLLGSPPERCLYFDNEAAFVEGARGAGMRAFLVDRTPGAKLSEPAVVGDLSGLSALARGGG